MKTQVFQYIPLLNLHLNIYMDIQVTKQGLDMPEELTAKMLLLQKQNLCLFRVVLL